MRKNERIIVNPIHRSKDPEYEMKLYVYPTQLCGEDMQKGSPLEITDIGADLFKLKMRLEELVLSVMSLAGYDGECFVEIRVTEDEKYCECDEFWADVDLVNKTVKFKRGYV